MFAVAESLMYAGKYKPAVDSLGRIAKDYPESSFAPKSRYTMAWIYEHNLANPDSALSQFKVLAAKHATTKYGEAALRRIPPIEADTSKKPVMEPMKKPAADTAAKSQTVGSTKAVSDTVMRSALKSLAPFDSLSDRNARPSRRGALRDTAKVRDTKKEGLE
jgi:hypothetical protein